MCVCVFLCVCVGGGGGGRGGEGALTSVKLGVFNSQTSQVVVTPVRVKRFRVHVLLSKLHAPRRTVTAWSNNQPVDQLVKQASKQSVNKSTQLCKSYGAHFLAVLAPT